MSEQIHPDPWTQLIASIRSHRAPGARFFKPVCVICAIDLMNEGKLNPSAIDANAVIHRFRRYVGVVHANRADQGWRPLWHLSNDGLWVFYDQDRPVTPEDFGSKRKPDMKGELFALFDRLAISRDLLPAWQSETHRQALRDAMLQMLARDDDTARPFARQLTHPELALTPDAWPPESALSVYADGREQLDLFGRGTGIERDDDNGIETDRIAEPFDPESIDVSTKTMTVDLLLSRVARNMIDLQPDFQRRWGIWTPKRQSRLIESLLLRIPLPVLYAAEDEDERWEIVDGIQRLSTIARFISPSIVNSQPLTLTGLEYLQDYEGRTFEDLSDRLKMRLRETELITHVIRKDTPPEVKFNIFARINTGGVALSAQELRHAITPGKARLVLQMWAESKEFITATDASVRTSRMDDRELVLRYLAFHLIGPAGYRQSDMDGFLIRAMRAINRLDQVELAVAHSEFARGMEAAYAIFGNDAFRKRSSLKDGRHPINKALFESVAVNLAQLPPESLAKLVQRADSVRSRFMKLCRDRDFEASISQGTGDVAKVNRRFADVAKMIARTLGEN